VVSDFKGCFMRIQNIVRDLDKLVEVIARSPEHVQALVDLYLNRELPVSNPHKSSVAFVIFSRDVPTFDDRLLADLLDHSDPEATKVTVMMVHGIPNRSQYASGKYTFPRIDKPKEQHAPVTTKRRSKTVTRIARPAQPAAPTNTTNFPPLPPRPVTNSATVTQVSEPTPSPTPPPTELQPVGSEHSLTTRDNQLVSRFLALEQNKLQSQERQDALEEAILAQRAELTSLAKSNANLASQVELLRASADKNASMESKLDFIISQMRPSH
jgi:hypothetical protein